MFSGRNVGECRYGGAYQWYRPLREAAMVRMGHNRRSRRRCFQLVLKDRPDQGQRLVSGCVGVLQTRRVAETGLPELDVARVRRWVNSAFPRMSAARYGWNVTSRRGI